MRIISKEEIIKRLNRIPDFSEYVVFEETLNGTSKKAHFKHNICNHEFDMIVKDYFRGQRCPKCAAQKRILSNIKDITKYPRKPKPTGARSKPVEYYSKKINAIDGYSFIKIDGDYFGNKSKAIIKHNVCNKTFSKTIIDFTSNKQYCPYCASTGRKNDFLLVSENFKKHNFILLETENTYKGTHGKSHVKCCICGLTQYKSYNSVVNLSVRCDCQVESKGESLIKEFLMYNKIQFEKEKTFDLLIDSGNLRYDFFIPSKNLIIEYDGIQHFKEILFFESSLEYIQSHDDLKNKYAENNGYNIIRISYKENTYEKLEKILKTILIDGKPYDEKLSRTVWIGGKSDYNSYKLFNS